MSVSFTGEQDELRGYVRQWLDARAPFEVVRRIMETEAGHDRSHWQELGELGWLGIPIDEEFGGAGSGFMELAVVAEEMGRSLYPSPFLSTIVLGSAIVGAAGTDDQKEHLLGAVAAGRRTLALAVAEPGGGWDIATVTAVAGRQGDGWVIDGTKEPVLDGHTADTLIVSATHDDGVSLFVVDGDADGVTRTRLDPMDLTRPLASVRFDGAQAAALGPGGGAGGVLAAAFDRAVAALAMEQVGGAQACLDMAVAYAKERHQFGRAIGSFQAIKHMCADMLVAVESAKSAAYRLAWAIDNDPTEVAVLAPLAKSYASDAYFQCASDTIQIHGGIGFTWEHDAHLYFKRAKSSQLLFGDSTYHRAILADRLGV
ncbi:acyl-CoA dehydrogenase family protein [soil metagenome]